MSRDVQLETLTRAMIDRFIELERATMTVAGFHTTDQSMRITVRAGYRSDGALSIQIFGFDKEEV